MQIFEHIIKEEGQKFLGWRNVPVVSSILGRTSGRYEPRLKQVFIGRNDDQVKIQGYRIELGDVCAGLRSCEDVKDAEVVVSTTESGEKILIGVVVLKEGAEIDDVAKAANRALPHYMVPRQFLSVDEIPRTERGKFDREKLRAMFRLAS